MATILDVIDNFFDDDVDFSTAPGATVLDFGAEVQRFSSSALPDLDDDGVDRVYLGGWPSANVWLSETGSLALTSLLYADGGVARDPLSDWFAPERHAIQTLLASRPGFRDPEGNALIEQTRRYLSIAVPALRSMRPLLENGLVVLRPYRGFLADNQSSVGLLSTGIVDAVVGDPLSFTRRFSPRDLAVEDNVRGMFVLAGGEREKQVRKMALRACEYFAGEYLFARSHGATYTAPFEFEQHLVEHGLGFAAESSGSAVVNALLRTNFPLFENLTPEVVASVRDDDSFGEIRSTIFDTYSAISPGLPEPEIHRAIVEAERSKLDPIVAKLIKDAESGALGRTLGAAGRATFRIGLGIAAAAPFASVAPAQALSAGLAREAASKAFESIRARGQPQPWRAWQTLHAHARSAKEEVRFSTNESGHRGDWWGMAEMPSMDVTVTEGQAIFDFGPQRPQEPLGKATGRNETCPCGSGLKFKRCCLGVN